MASGTTGPAGALIQTLFDVGTAAGLSDRALIERFLRRGDGAESAFAGLVERHGPMVLRVCRDVLRDVHDADDAFQAVFLVLARRAGSIRCRESLGAWLYGVALRVARCARKGVGRRREVERKGAEMRAEEESDGVERLDAAPVLHDEVGRLPEKFREALVLCYFEGLTHEQAAGQLGWPVGTVRSRLARARDRLRLRLTRRGLAPSAAFLGASASDGANSAVVPTALASATVSFAMRAAYAGAVPATVAALASRALRAMMMTKIKMMATGVVAAGLVASAGVGLVSGGQGPGRQSPGERPVQGPSGPVVDGGPRPGPRADNPPSPAPRAEVSQAAGGSTSESPRVLWVRFKSAHDALLRTRRLFETGLLGDGAMQGAQAEVETLSARLEARRDEILDQIELLTAQLAIREADVATAKAQLGQATAKLDPLERMAKHNAVSNSDLQEAKQEVAIRASERDKRLAEVAEVRVRIAQATRQKKLIESYVAQANELLAKSGGTNLIPSGPAPPAPAR